MDIRPHITSEIREEDQVYTETITSNINGETVYKKHQNLNDLQDRPGGTVTIGGTKEPICVLHNTALTVPGLTSRLNTDWPYLAEQAKHHNLPNGLV